MAARAESGIGDRSLSKLERLDRVLVTAATITALLFAVFLVLGAAVARDRDLLLRLAGPLVVGGVGAFQLWRRRPDARVQLAAGAAILIAQTGLAGPDPPALLGVLAMAITGVLLVRQHHVVYVVVVGALLSVLGVWWASPSLPTNQKLLTSMGPALLFVFTAVLVQWMRHELEAGRARYQNLFYRAPVPIWEIDCSAVSRWLEERRAEGVTEIRQYLAARPDALREVAALARVIDVNDAGVAFVGASDRNSLVGPIRIDRLPPGLDEAFLAQLDALWEGEPVARANLSVTRRDGSQVEGAMTSAAQVRAGRLDPANIITTVNDVTERNRTERRLQELVRSKDEFVASVSHEVRTPLTAVVGLAEELRDRYGDFDPGEVQELVSVIADQSTEVAHIVEDLLVAARKDIGSLQLERTFFDLRCEVLALVAGWRSAVDVDGGADSGAPLTCGDPARVRQIMRNLLINADRYGGGSTRVRIWNSVGSSGVEVRDAGPPIPAQEREAIFHPYYRARQVDGLTASVGLGLTVSRQLARLMGGDVTYTHDGVESIFSLELPNADRDAGADQPIAASTSDSVGVPISASS